MVFLGFKNMMNMDFFNDTCIKLSLNPYKIKTSTVTDLNQFSSFVWIFNLEKITDLKMKIMLTYMERLDSPEKRFLVPIEILY